MTPRVALVAGATGAVGQALLPILAADPAYREIVVLARRPRADLPSKVSWRVVDFERLEDTPLPKVDDVFCALGTTMKQAGSEAAFRKVDFEYVVAVGRAGRAAGATRFVLNSSVGADPQSRSFYLRVKGEAEAALAGLGYATLALVRPSLLVAERSERRPGEAAAMKLAPLFNPLLVGPLGRYKAVDVATVARAMRGAARVISGRRVIEHGEILGLAAEA
jgi:uncharacterized protein YbjT (DUF2867 family)